MKTDEKMSSAQWNSTMTVAKRLLKAGLVLRVHLLPIVKLFIQICLKSRD